MYMSGLCTYRNIFGEPGTGVHKYRIFNIAIVDVSLVILFGLLISYFFKISIGITLGVLFLVGIIVHRLFCVHTTVDRFLFG